METCNSGHDDICYLSNTKCPLCQALNKCAEQEEELEELRAELENNKE